LIFYPYLGSVSETTNPIIPLTIAWELRNEDYHHDPRTTAIAKCSGSPPKDIRESETDGSSYEMEAKLKAAK
jgi:hypothetical protein